jgi:hypothetical protein
MKNFLLLALLTINHLFSACSKKEIVKYSCYGPSCFFSTLGNTTLKAVEGCCYANACLCCDALGNDKIQKDNQNRDCTWALCVPLWLPIAVVFGLTSGSQECLSSTKKFLFCQTNPEEGFCQLPINDSPDLCGLEKSIEKNGAVGTFCYLCCFKEENNRSKNEQRT